MQTKIILSEEERLAINNCRFFEVKREISHKVESIFSGVVNDQELKLDWKKIIAQQDWKILEGKISRGENYKGFPWLMLDYPRNFSNENVFAVRNFFWWGFYFACKKNVFAVRNFFWWGFYFACNFQLSGESLKKYLPIIERNQEQLAEKKIYLSLNKSSWIHKVDEENFVLLKSDNLKMISSTAVRNGYLKLSAVHTLSEFEKAVGFFQSYQKLFQQIISG